MTKSPLRPYQQQAIDALNAGGAVIIKLPSTKAGPDITGFVNGRRVEFDVASPAARPMRGTRAELDAAIGQIEPMGPLIAELQASGYLLCAPLTTISPNQRYGLIDDGMGNLARVPGSAWAAAHYHATSGAEH